MNLTAGRNNLRKTWHKQAARMKRSGIRGNFPDSASSIRATLAAPERFAPDEFGHLA